MTVTPPTWCIAAAIAVLVGGAATSAGQVPPRTPNLSITALGGFVGYYDPIVIDGVAEGGLIAVEDWLQRPGNRDDLLLISGNNAPFDDASQFWDRLANLQADAVAFSIDDFLRALRLEGAHRLLRELSLPNAPPFVASNAYIRIRKDGLNTTRSNGFSIDVNGDESVDWWTRSIAVTGGACGGVTIALTDETMPVPLATSCTPGDTRHFAVELKPSLRPERSYVLTITPDAAPARPAIFRFRTHGLLTKLGPTAKGVVVPPALVGLPLRFAQRTFEPPHQTPIIVAALVNPDAKKRLGRSRWTWRSEDAACTNGDTCEIEFMPPADALEALALLAQPAGPREPPPLWVLMSGLTDLQTIDLTSSAPQIFAGAASYSVPVVILDPDSFVLRDDVGFESIVNAHDAATTQIWARPPWVGGRAARITARLSWQPQGRWHVDTAAVRAERIVAPRTTAVVSGQEVEYQLTLPNRPPVSLGRYEVYPFFVPSPSPPPPPAALDRDAIRSDLWSNAAGLMLDVMREAAHADLALLPMHFLDEDVMTWLAGELVAGQRLDWLSKFVLSKALYRMETIVTANVEGSRLAGVLDAMARAAAADTDALCIAGIGTSACQTSIGAGALHINRREIASDRFYKIALPQSLAEANGLDDDREALPSLLDAVDARLRSFAGGGPRPFAEYVSALDRRYANRPQLYVNINPANLSYTWLTPADPDGALAHIPLAGSAVRKERQLGLSGRADAGLDHWRAALRAIGEVKFARNTLTDPPTYPEDEWTIGVRGDLKFRAGAGRLFYGWFRQSQFRERQDEPITPVRPVPSAIVPETGEVLTNLTTAGAAVIPIVRDPLNPDKPAYRFQRVGIELSQYSPWRWLAFKDLAAAFDWGTADNARTAITIGELGPFPIGSAYQAGIASFVSQQFQRNPAAFAAPQNLTFSHDDHDQHRLQFDGTIEHPLNDRLGLTTTIRLRRYLNAVASPDLTPTLSFESKTKIEWTLVNRLKVGPYADYYRVRAKGLASPAGYFKFGAEASVPIHASIWPIRAFD